MTTITTTEAVTELLEGDVKYSLAEQYKDDERVAKIADGIDLAETLSIINLGTESQSELSAFVANELSNTKANAMSTDSMESLGEVIDEIKSVNVSDTQSKSFWAKLPIIGDRIAHTFDNVAMQFDTVDERVDRIVVQIKGEMSVIDESVGMFDVLDQKYRSLIDEFEHYIAAGEAKMQKELKGTYPVLRAKAIETGDPRDIEAFNTFQNQLVRLNRRVTSMMTARHVAIESLPSIRALQTNFLQFKEEFTEVVNTVIPMWKRQFLLAVEQNKAGKIVNISKSVKDYSNKQYLDFKEQMYGLEKDINETLSRGILDPETLVMATDLTILAIEEHKKRLELTYETQEKTKGAINEGQRKLQEALMVEVVK
ncbi:toxic anion resistance protein [Vibrio sp. D431a]|uniref:toxic anion resistance protein n=1 Tax=Vibrio sp. D431a TaxID=2837388 RepID=UPI002555EDAC|nr:toxic anion resistance protein [Vibrio sp. D431a]MDK9793278.1 toxic anion resistance protein [Vibrio sp. D431a]